uniref:HNH endonuclease n=1 Tax=Pithovirus LCPAC401 TaxID=2506595 RepID=A0A481ZBP9_9VIRU|nr:MAG: HNH endonuclease [Pithovirus LCPAC401]
MKTSKRCKIHDDSSQTKKVEKLFQCAAIVKSRSNKGKRCPIRIEIENGLCGRHPKKEIHRIEHEEEKCEKCDETVEWVTMKSANYDISTIGQIYSYKYLEGHSNVDGYRIFRLTDNDDKIFDKRMHTFQGIIFLSLMTGVLLWIISMVIEIVIEFVVI